MKITLSTIMAVHQKFEVFKNGFHFRRIFFNDLLAFTGYFNNSIKFIR